MGTSKYRGKRIGVLSGGLSREREISLRSGKNISDGLINLDLDVVNLDIGRDAAQMIAGANIDIAFLALHGTFGEDGCIQGLLEFMNIPYTGSGVAASAVSMDKLLSKKILSASSIAVPNFVGFENKESNQIRKEIKDVLGFPVVLKARAEGSSIGVEIIHNEKELESRLDSFLKDFPDSFAEEYFRGREVTVGIIGDSRSATVLPVLELIPENEFYDFEAKYTEGMTNLSCPADLPPDAAEAIAKAGLDAFRVLGLSGVARIDFMLDKKLKPFAMEANTIPGMTATSDIPAMAKAAGMSFEEVLLQILDCVDCK